MEDYKRFEEKCLKAIELFVDSTASKLVETTITAMTNNKALRKDMKDLLYYLQHNSYLGNDEHSLASLLEPLKHRRMDDSWDRTKSTFLFVPGMLIFTIFCAFVISVPVAYIFAIPVAAFLAVSFVIFGISLTTWGVVNSKKYPPLSPILAPVANWQDFSVLVWNVKNHLV